MTGSLLIKIVQITGHFSLNVRFLQKNIDKKSLRKNEGFYLLAGLVIQIVA